MDKSKTMTDWPGKTGQTREAEMKITGTKAIEIARALGMPINKHGDPIEGPRDDLDVEEAEEVAREDDGLLWVEIPGEQTAEEVAKNLLGCELGHRGLDDITRDGETAVTRWLHEAREAGDRETVAAILVAGEDEVAEAWLPALAERYAPAAARAAIKMMNVEDKADFLADPEGWRDGLGSQPVDPMGTIWAEYAWDTFRDKALELIGAGRADD